MTPKAQRIAIAEACGLRVEIAPQGGYYVVIQRNDLRPDGYVKGAYHIFEDGALREIPDYIHDLNAIHEAEKVLTDNQLVNYYRHLRDICGEWVIDAVRATAAQRAEAFLRTLNLWQDETNETTLY